MKRPAVNETAGRPAHHHRRRRIPQIMSLGHEVRNLVERAHDEVDELQLRNRPQPCIAHPASRPDNGALTDRRIDHALPSKTLQQSFARLERPAVHTDVLPEQHHRRVALHLFKHRLLDGFEKRDLRAVFRFVIGRHGYLFTFLLAPEVTAAFADFFTAGFAPYFPGALPPLAGISMVFFVSPKWIGAFAPPELLPDPNPATVQTALTLDFGGVTSAIGRSHFAWILWQSSPVQYTPVSANSGGGIGEFSANSRSAARRLSIFSSISFLLLASSSFSPIKNFSYNAMGSRPSQ